jgi:uncharacterized protein (TIGR03437 family)
MTSKLLRCALLLVSTTLIAQDRGFVRDAVPGHWEGRVAMRVEENLAAGTSRTVVSLRTAAGALEIAPDSVNPAWKPNQRISIDGRLSGTRIAVDRWSPQDVHGIQAGAAAPETVSGTCSTTGEQKVAVLMLSFPSTPFPSYVTASYVQSTLFGPDPSTAGLISAASYGQTTVTGQVLGPISMPTDFPIEDFEDIANAAITAADQLIDLREYNRIVMMAPTKIVAGDPEAFIGCMQLNSPSYGPFNGSLIFMPAEESDSPFYFYRAIAHELGHNFGVEHSNSLDYGVETLGPPGFMGLSTEYGDEFVTMGAEFAGHYVAQHKVMFGWLASNTGYRTVATSGSYTLEPYGTATGGLKALKVTRGTGGTSYLWIEYRQPTDSYEVNMGTYSQSIYSGAYIHYDDGSGSTWTYLTSFQPGSTNKFVTPVLAAGSSWSDPYSDLKIQVGAATSAGLPITISYGNTSGCATTISPATVQPASTGGPATANVTAPSSCAWTATSNVSWITFTGSTSGTGNGTINYTVAANSLSQTRFGRVTAGGMSLGVVQAEAPGSITAIAANSVTFPATGGSGQLAVTVSTADYAWGVPFDWNWVQVTSATGVGSGTLIYVVGENTGPARSVTIPVGNFSYVINQAAGSPASSQMDWLQIDTAGTTPSPRFSYGLAYFGPTGETILYGGVADTTYYGDTWGWNGSVWTQKSPAHSPGTRVAHVMIYDPVRQQVVMFGGYSPSSPYQLNDTWVWNGTDWTQLNPAHSPPIRANAAAVFDTVNQVVVMFGGTNYHGELSDTWVWDGTDWTQKFPLTSPPARDSQAMAYDPVRQETVMFGGAESPQAGDPGGTWYQDTWTWDGSNWHSKNIAAPPIYRSGQAMVYDPDLGRILMYGGTSTLTPNTPYSPYYFPVDTWTWNGVAWQQLFPTTIPGGAYTYRMIWDDNHKQLIMYVGDDLTCKNRGPKTWTVTPGAGVISANPGSTNVAATGGSAMITIQGSASWSATTTDSWITVPSGQGTGSGTVSFSAAANPYGLGRTGHVLVGGLAVQVVQAAAAAGAPQISDGGVVNAADDRTAFSPGTFMSIYGGGFATTPSQAPGAPLPATLGGTSVEIIDNGQNGQLVNAPLFFVAPGQINAQMPFNVVGPLQVQVRTSIGVSDPVNIGLLVSSPKLFTTTLNGLGQAIALHADYSLVSAASPAHHNETIILYLTGLGAVSPSLPAGAGGGDGSPGNPLNVVITTPTVTIAGLPANVTWAGLAPYYPGLYQLNVQLPNAQLSSESTVIVQGGATPSQSGVYINTAY